MPSWPPATAEAHFADARIARLATVTPDGRPHVVPVCFALHDGVVFPPVRIKDNIRLGPNTYRILVGGQEIARGDAEPGMCLAMDSGTCTGRIQGRATTDPAFGLPALWIAEAHKEEAELLGYTVIDPVSVVVTHLSETLKGSMGEVLSRDDRDQTAHLTVALDPPDVARFRRQFPDAGTIH